ncbi:hypothetical protein C8Q79DRAFT_997666 [Trametes meyenii]|nr:hypothetical protein C8Q79DRAFT_997666 [Trametes meyenii]
MDCLGWRLQGFRPTEWDYRVYEERAYDILVSPRGRAAILHGGLLWRLALEILGSDAIGRAVQGPSEGVFEYTEVVKPRHGPAYYDDALTPEEIDIVCGTYKIADSGHKTPVYWSWWPRPAQWKSSGLNMGYWTKFDEEWFQERLASIRRGTSTPMTASLWKALRFHKGSIRIRYAVDNESTKFLSDVLLRALA